jgi:NAD(P)-dependent dehydrogenase (short-subunit alcohol dehydrogenase family)
LVTGGAHGIGRAAVQEAEARGLSTICFDLDPTEGGYLVDVADPEQVEDAMDRDWSEHGPINGLVNNAGVVHRASLIATSPAEFSRVLAINLVGAYSCLHSLARRWTESEMEAHVVNITSAHAVLAQRERTAYAASKAGLESLSRSAALELGPLVKVYALAAGYTRTEEGRTRLVGDRGQAAGRRVPLGRVIDAFEVAAAAIDLVTGRFPAMTGQVMRLDGGWSSSDVELERLT